MGGPLSEKDISDLLDEYKKRPSVDRGGPDETRVLIVGSSEEEVRACLAKMNQLKLKHPNLTVIIQEDNMDVEITSSGLMTINKGPSLEDLRMLEPPEEPKEKKWTPFRENKRDKYKHQSRGRKHCAKK